MAAGEVSARDFIEVVARHNHNGLIGSRYVDEGENWIELALDYDVKLVGDRDSGILASGPITSMCDMAAGLAISKTSGRFLMTVTIDLRADYLRPAKVGNAVHGRMECYRCTRNVAFVRGHAHDGDPGDPIAQITGTFMFLAPLS
ncbi:MAG: PaaI family thioesterase [Sphingomonadaceae bacterium]|nr:PaaI family thioesterase [Sphingomonadaceae bacterium]